MPLPLPYPGAFSRGGGGGGGGPPVNNSLPVISGTPESGETASCSTGSWSGAAPITFAFQWRRDTVNISGATSQTYLLQVADEGTTVDCVVTATNDEGSAGATANGVSVTAPFSDGLSLESGDRILLESGDFILLEAA